MAYALQQLINGVTLGMIYGLIAIGYTMVYGIVGIINFAHGDVFMVGSFVALAVLTGVATAGIASAPLALLLALLISAAVAALYGWTIERVAYRPLRGSFRLAPLISAIGVSIALQNFMQLSQGAREKPMPPMLAGGVDLVGGAFAVQLSWTATMAIVVTLVVLAGFTWLVTATPLGRAMRACEQDAGMAALIGIDADRTISWTFMLGAALAAVAGELFLLRYGVIDFSIGFLAGVKAFTAAVLGGIGNLPGAVIGGLLMGVIETFWSAYFSPAYKDVAAFAILILTLLVLPNGLFGRAAVQKV